MAHVRYYKHSGSFSPVSHTSRTVLSDLLVSPADAQALAMADRRPAVASAGAKIAGAKTGT